MMLYQERADFIRRELENKSIVKSNELVQQMGVSIDTIRRDLKKMESDGLLRCIRGGASLLESQSTISTFDERKISHVELKKALCHKALDWIHEGDMVALNAGTTNAILAAEMLNLHFPFTVITNNLSVLHILSTHPSIELIGIGGFVDKKENAFYGKNCENEFKQYNPDVCFLSINAISIENGFTDFRYNDFPIMNLLAKRSQTVIALMDSSKFGKKSTRNLFKLNDIDLLISDDTLNASTTDLFLESGLKIV